jgi:hypothetical protein
MDERADLYKNYAGSAQYKRLETLKNKGGKEGSGRRVKKVELKLAA